MAKMTEVLLVEDDATHVKIIRRAFARCSNKYSLTVASSLKEASEALGRSTPGVAILDWVLPDGNGSNFLDDAKERSEFPVVVMTSHGSEEIAIEAMKAGAMDYVVKQPENLLNIPRLVDRTLREWDHIVERKRAEEELDRYREHLEELVESRTKELLESRECLRQSERLAAVGTLAAGIAHEINNPIAAILAAAQFALIAGEHEVEARAGRQVLRDIERQAIRCGKIVKSILQFSRNQPTEKWDRDLRDIVSWVRDTSRLYATQCGVEVRVEMASSPLMIIMNPVEIEQVLLNLVNNAIESDSVDHLVTLRCHRKLDSACIEVCDQGRGIPREDLPRIFDPFYTTRLKQGRSGLGLSVAHGIVEEHGGSMAAESCIDGGTTMRLSLPLIDSLP